MQNLRWQRQEMMQIRYHKNETLVAYTAYIGAGQKGEYHAPFHSNP